MRILNYYPNPTVGKVKLEFYSPDEKLITIYVFNSMGKSISSEVFNPKEGKNTFEVDLGSLPMGVYLVTISNQSNKSSCRVMKKM